jgi:hypothetical protein
LKRLGWPDRARVAGSIFTGCALLDIGLRVMDGYELVEHLSVMMHSLAMRNGPILKRAAKRAFCTISRIHRYRRLGQSTVVDAAQVGLSGSQVGEPAFHIDEPRETGTRSSTKLTSPRRIPRWMAAKPA